MQKNQNSIQRVRPSEKVKESQTYGLEKVTMHRFNKNFTLFLTFKNILKTYIV